MREFQVLSRDDNQRQELEQGRLELIHDIRQQRNLLDRYREVCEEAQSKTHYERTGQNIKDVKLGADSLLLVGIINAEGEESKIKQSIRDVSAESGSVGVVG